MTRPEDLWGEDFAQKRKMIVAKKIQARTQVTPAMRREIIGMCKTAFTGGRQAFDYPCGQSTYNVLLVKAPNEMNPFKFESGDFSLKVDWQGTQVSISMSPEQLSVIKAGEFYVVVGFLKPSGRWNNFYLRSLITLDQIADSGVEAMEVPPEPVKEEPVDLVAKSAVTEDVVTKDVTPVETE